MSDFLEFEKETKAMKSINLDDFSVEDLKKYINDLTNELTRVKVEIEKKPLNIHLSLLDKRNLMLCFG